MYIHMHICIYITWSVGNIALKPCWILPLVGGGPKAAEARVFLYASGCRYREKCGYSV